MQTYRFDQILGDITNVWSNDCQVLRFNVAGLTEVKAATMAIELAKKHGLPVRVSDAPFSWAKTFNIKGRCIAKLNAT